MHRIQQTLVLLALLTIPAETLPAGPNLTNRKEDNSETTPSSTTDHTLERMIRRYSQQEVICLDVDEEYTFRLKDRSERVIRLVSVEEFRDDIIGQMRRAEIDVEINGTPLHLTCAPYIMPTESDGINIQADTTSGWLSLPKKVQFSIWDSTDPVVNTKRFTFPIPNYLLFSHGMQCYNEVVHWGRYDGDPKGAHFCHDYGIDIAGYVRREEIVSCTDGEVVSLRPSEQKAYYVTIQDDGGFLWLYGHLDSILPSIRKGAYVRMGQRIGMLGAKGASGNFSHLHLGTYLSRADLERRVRNRRLNLYPWIVAAYQGQYHKDLYAVARPHQVVSTGQKVVFDGSNSLAFGTRIVSHRWEFHDGEAIDGIRVEKRFDVPGVYVATLWVEDEKGNRDVDFQKVKVFTKSAPESRIPTIFMTHTPSQGIVVDQPVRLCFWLQTRDVRPITVDFGDGTTIAEYASYTEVTHRFRTPGIHVVTTQATIDGKPIMQKQKVVVKGLGRE